MPVLITPSKTPMVIDGERTPPKEFPIIKLTSLPFPLLLCEILASLLSPLPPITSHYMKFADAQTRSPNLSRIGWFSKMNSIVLNFKRPTQKKGVQFFPAAFPTKEVFKVMMLNKEMKEKVEGIWQIQEMRKYYETEKIIKILIKEPEIEKFEG